MLHAIMALRRRERVDAVVLTICTSYQRSGECDTHHTVIKDETIKFGTLI